MTIPGRKNVFRLYGKEGYALLDLMQGVDEIEPKPNQKVLCRHPFQESKRCYATPSKVEPLLKIWWKDGKVGFNCIFTKLDIIELKVFL